MFIVVGGYCWSIVSVRCISSCVMFFFFKQKTAYEMRISDWSSDVCSSDLLAKSAAGACHCGAAGQSAFCVPVGALRYVGGGAGHTCRPAVPVAAKAARCGGG